MIGFKSILIEVYINYIGCPYYIGLKDF